MPCARIRVSLGGDTGEAKVCVRGRTATVVVGAAALRVGGGAVTVDLGSCTLTVERAGYSTVRVTVDCGVVFEVELRG